MNKQHTQTAIGLLGSTLHAIGAVLCFFVGFMAGYAIMDKLLDSGDDFTSWL